MARKKARVIRPRQQPAQGVLPKSRLDLNSIRQAIRALPEGRWLQRRLAWLLPASLSGVLLGLAFPPFNCFWLSWIGLVPLLWALTTEAGRARALRMGWLAGTVMFLFVLRPLESANLWSGWEMVERAQVDALKAERAVALTGLWIGVSAWIGFYWGLFARGLAWLARGNVLRMAWLAPALVVLLPEWLRALMVFDSTWGFLGNTVVPVPGILQLAALGGVSLLSGLVVLVNVAVLALLMPGPRAQRRWLPAGVAALMVVGGIGGLLWSRSLPSIVPEGEGIAVAALQYHQEHYRASDYTSVGLEKAYLQLMHQAAQGELGDIDLLVLPESISYVPMSLDGSHKSDIPDEAQQSTENWQAAMRWVMGYSDKPFHLVFGMDTIEKGELHNTMVFWNREGLKGHYHKQGLVPFGEYQPPLLKALGLRGRVQYTSGTQSRIVDLDGLKVGSFICQEVVEPQLLRRSVLDGAQLLASGGNDGVFTHPAVTEVNAMLARLRAVETGRYIVRAMKTGVSAVIAPTGEELRSSPGSEPFVAISRVKALDSITPYVRFGDWVVGLAALLMLGGVVRRLRPLHQVNCSCLTAMRRNQT